MRTKLDGNFEGLSRQIGSRYINPKNIYSPYTIHALRRQPRGLYVANDVLMSQSNIQCIVYLNGKS